MISFSCRTVLFVISVVSLSRVEAQGPDSTQVYEALFTQLDSLGLDKTYYIREREGRDVAGVGYPVSFPDDLVFHTLGDFGRISVSLVDESFVSGLWDSGCREGWENFHRRYPSAGELTQVSQVVFAESGGSAFVYLEQGSGCQSACGSVYRLTTEAGQWLVVGRESGWCS